MNLLIPAMAIEEHTHARPWGRIISPRTRDGVDIMHDDVRSCGDPF